MQTVETFIKDNKIVDPRRIALVKETSAKLTKQNLPHSNRVELVSDALEITSRSCHELVSNTSFTEQHKDIFLQETGVAMFILEAGFPLKNVTLVKTVKTTIKENIAKIRGLPVTVISDYIDYSDRETWDTLKYNAIEAMASNLVAEVKELRWHLGLFEPYFISPVKICSLKKDYFQLEVSYLDNIVQEGWNEHIKTNRAHNVVFKDTAMQIYRRLRHKSFVDYSNNFSQTNYESELFSSTGKKIIDNRYRRSITDLADESQLKEKTIGLFFY